MKIENPLFFSMKKSDGLSSMLIIQRKDENGGLPFIRLSVNVPIKFSDKVEMVLQDFTTEVSVTNFSTWVGSNEKKEVVDICFHESCGYNNHIKTFLDYIKKDSDVSFVVYAFVGHEPWKEVGMESHQLIGVIDGKKFLLSKYVGAGNSASPVR